MFKVIKTETVDKKTESRYVVAIGIHGQITASSKNGNRAILLSSADLDLLGNYRQLKKKKYSLTIEE